jgi:hypothetical protein
MSFGDGFFVPRPHDDDYFGDDRFGCARAAVRSFAFGAGGFFSRSNTRKLSFFRELHMIGILDNGFGRSHRVSHDEVRQVGVVQRHRTHQQLARNPQGVLFHRYSRHTTDDPRVLYTFQIAPCGSIAPRHQHLRPK